MEHIFQLLIAGIGCGLVAGVAAGFGAFYTFNGRLSRVEAQLEFLKNALSNQYPLIEGVPIPAPAIGKPVGGANAIIDTLNLGSHEIQQEEISVVFELVTGGEALVNLVRGGHIGITDIKLVTLTKEEKTSGNGADYAAIVSMVNLSDQNISFVIPKGQVFENREPHSGRQNLAAADERKQTILARTKYELKVDAHCMNKDLSGPDGSLGNLTVFKIRDDSFDGQEEIWQSVNDAVNKARLVVEGRRKGARKT